MSTRLEELEGLERRLTLELPAEELEERVADRLERLRRKVKISGFRPGKVPRKYLQRRFGARIRQEQAEGLAQAELSKALAKHSLRPVAAPTVEVEALDSTPRAVATFEVFPPLPELDLAGLEVEIPRVTMTEADVDEMRARLEVSPEDMDDLRETMARELGEALEEERLTAVEQALIDRYPDLELPAAILEAQIARWTETSPPRTREDAEELEEEARYTLTLAFLFAEITRQRNLEPDPARLWQRTQEMAAHSGDPTAELDEIWSDGELIHELEEELLCQDIAEVVLAEAQVKEVSMSFRELARRRQGVVEDEEDNATAAENVGG